MYHLRSVYFGNASRSVYKAINFVLNTLLVSRTPRCSIGNNGRIGKEKRSTTPRRMSPNWKYLRAGDPLKKHRTRYTAWEIGFRWWTPLPEQYVYLGYAALYRHSLTVCNCEHRLEPSPKIVKCPGWKGSGEEEEGAKFWKGEHIVFAQRLCVKHKENTYTIG